MGLHMATNLKKNGFTVKGFDLSEKTRDAAFELVSKFIVFILCRELLHVLR